MEVAATSSAPEAAGVLADGTAPVLAVRTAATGKSDQGDAGNRPATPRLG